MAIKAPSSLGRTFTETMESWCGLELDTTPAGLPTSGLMFGTENPISERFKANLTISMDVCTAFTHSSEVTMRLGR